MVWQLVELDNGKQWATDNTQGFDPEIALEIIAAVKEALDASTIDYELWAEIDKIDDGVRISVPMTVMDLKRLRNALVAEKASHQ